MQLVKLANRMVDASTDLRYRAERFVDLQHAYLLRARHQSHKVMLRCLSLREKDRVPFLQLYEADMLMDRLLNQRISLIVVFEKHL